MKPLRVCGVSFLNARPLVAGLAARPDRFPVRYDPPSPCARLLHTHETHLGLIPSIEYLRGEGYAIVPDCAVASDGPVAVKSPPNSSVAAPDPACAVVK